MYSHDVLGSVQAQGDFSYHELGDGIPTCLEQVRTYLQHPSDDSAKCYLRICRLNAAAPAEHGLDYFQILDQLRFVVSQQATQATKAMIQIIGFCLGTHWKIEDLASHIDGVAKLARETVAVTLPSGSRPLQPMAQRHVDFSWKRRAPLYESDRRVYTWQPFSRKPELARLRVLIRTDAAGKAASVGWVASSGDVLKRLKGSYHYAVNHPEARTFGDGGIKDCSIDHKILWCLLIVYKQIRDDLKTFLEQSTEEYLKVVCIMSPWAILLRADVS